MATGSLVKLAITASGTSIVGSAYALTGPQLTLIRTRGLYRSYLKSATTAGDGFQGAFGICVVQSAAFDAGVTALPGPISEINSEAWIYHAIVSTHANTSAEAEFMSHAVTQELIIDSKAMRKLDAENTVVAVLEVTMAGTATMDVFHDSRALFKL